RTGRAGALPGEEGGRDRVAVYAKPRSISDDNNNNNGPDPTACVSSKARAGMCRPAGSRRLSQAVKRDFQISSSVCLGQRQLSAIDVDLQRMKDQPGHGQGAVASFSHRHKLRLRAVVGDVDVLCLLLSNRAFPFWITTAGAIIV